MYSHATINLKYGSLNVRVSVVLAKTTDAKQLVHF